MVNVNKNIVPGKSAESAAKTDPQATARRPRNQELNSSKKQSGQDRLAALRKQKLNCSAGNIPAGYEQYYQVISEQEFSDTVGSEVDNLRGIVADIEDEYGEKIVGYIKAKPEYNADLIDANLDVGFITESGGILNGADNSYIGLDEVKRAVTGHEMNSSREGVEYTAYSKANLSSLEEEWGYGTGELVDLVNDGERQIGGKFLGISDDQYFVFEEDGKPVAYEQSHDRWFPVDSSCKTSSKDTTDMDSSKNRKRMNCSTDTKITTESGNEVSMQDIKIVQNPDTNELAIFIPEDEEETIPEGFIVIGMVIPDAVGGTPAIEGGEDEEDEEDEGELDSSKKKMS